MLIDLRKYNEDLNDTIKKSNLHAKTLHENIEFVCGHVELEYRKHNNDITRPDTSDSDDDKSELRHTLLFWEAF